MILEFKPNEIVFAINMSNNNKPISIHKCTIECIHVYKNKVEYSLKDVDVNEEWGDTTDLVFKTLRHAVAHFEIIDKP